MKKQARTRPLFQHHGSTWRTFACTYCHTEKRWWMMRRAPIYEAQHEPVDFRQNCPTCKKITPHVETTADNKQSHN